MEDSAALIPGAHRPVRWLDARESGYAGELVADGESMRVRVDAGSVPEMLWTCAAAEHVAGVIDVVRRRDGQDALLPWCTDPIDVFLARRAAAERPLSSGEIVTLVGSLLRGILEMDATGAEVGGRWWLDDDSRPRFVPGEGSVCGAAAGEIISRVRESCADRAIERMLTEIAAGVHDARVVRRSIEGWERDLTELAAPRPLDREVFAPERVSAIPLHQALIPQDAGRIHAQREVTRGAERAWAAMRERLAELEWRRPRWLPTVRRAAPAGAVPRAARTGGRGRMLLIGACVAGVVLAGGLMWPTDGEDSSASVVEARDELAEAPAASTSPEPSPAPVTESPEAVPVEPADSMTQAVVALLAQIGSCAAEEDLRCERAVVDGAGETVSTRLGSADAEREITPVEDYGDIAVVRLSAAGDAGEQMLVIVRQKDGWLVRDVYDVADQPSEVG